MAIGTPVGFGNVPADTTSNTATVTLPTITTAGYVAIVVGLNSATNDVFSAPAGYYRSADSPITTGTTQRGSLWFKAVTSADSGLTLTFGLSASQRWVVGGVYVPGAGGLGATVNWVDDSGDTSLDIPAITPAHPDALRLVIASVRYTSAAGTTAEPSGWTEYYDQCTSNASGARVGIWIGGVQLTGQQGVAQTAATGTHSTGSRNAAWELTLTPTGNAVQVQKVGAVATVPGNAVLVHQVQATATPPSNAVLVHQISAASTGPTNAVLVHQLSATAASPPIPDAGPDQSNVTSFSTVTLSGSATNGTPDTWTWVAPGGITLSGTGATRTFTAPANAAGISLTFSLTVTNANGTSSADTVVVNVLPHNEWMMTVGGLKAIRPF